MSEEKKKSWKTTTCGILGLVIALAVGAKALLDDNPMTSVDIAAVTAAMAAVFPSIGNLVSKDDD